MVRMRTGWGCCSQLYKYLIYPLPDVSESSITLVCGCLIRVVGALHHNVRDSVTESFADSCTIFLQLGYECCCLTGLYVLISHYVYAQIIKESHDSTTACSEAATETDQLMSIHCSASG